MNKTRLGLGEFDKVRVIGEDHHDSRGRGRKVRVEIMGKTRTVTGLMCPNIIQ